MHSPTKFSDEEIKIITDACAPLDRAARTSREITNGP